MNEQELEQALRAALRPADPGDDFADVVLARLRMPGRLHTPARHYLRMPLHRWGLTAVLAACVIAAVGLVRWRQQTVQWQRGLAARAQLLQALNIASANVNAVRAVVIREEEARP